MTAISNDIFIPEHVSVARPLLIALHGGGREGASQIEIWKPSAEKEQFFVLAPSSLNQWWTAKEDRQNLANIANQTISSFPIDRKRIYLFGHSLGGTIAFFDGYENRAVIAAVALHSPTPAGGIYQLPQQLGTRRLTMGVWVGEEVYDGNWHCASAMQFSYKDHPNLEIDLRVLPKHHHNDIYTRPGLTDEIWSFLTQHSL